MKRALLALILALPLALSAQFRIVGTGLFTTLNDSTYRAKIDFRPDLTGNSYNATQLTDSMLVLSQKGQLYRLDSFYNASFSSAFIVVVEKNGNWGSPVGQVMVFQNNSSLAAPQAVYGANGATAGMQAGVDTWNALLLKVVSDSAVYWNQAYSNSIDSLNVSGDSLKTITLYRAGGDSISATFVDGGGSGPVTDTLHGEVKGPLDSTYIDTVANIIFTTTTDTTVGVGELEYNDTQGSLIQGLKGGNVTNVIGQQIHQRVTNATGGPLTKGTAVFLHGSQGNRITVRKALATVDSTSANTFGIVAESIANNQSGYVITEGLITNMNTNALTEGAAVYLSPTVAGELTTTKPQAPQHTVYIGVCVKQNAGSGELFVKIRNGQELDELHDVRIDSLASNASLYYNAAQGVWRDTTGAVLTSDTSVFARDFQISGTAGQVAYFNAANAVTSDTAFRWSAANKTLGINTSTTSGANIIIKNSQEPSRSTVVSTQTFAADTTNWTRGTGWTFSGGVAVATAATGALTYTPALTITSGNAYEVTYTISGYSAGTLTAAVGNATYALPTHNATGNVIVLLPTSATGGFRFTTSTFTGNLDNVSVVQIASPAPVLLAGQDDNSTTLYSSLVIPNSTSFAFGGGGVYITGNNNVANGSGALYSNTTGSGNAANGYRALFLNTTGISNTANGSQALYFNTTGSGNVGIGQQALQSNTTGNSNIGIGQQALQYNTTGNNNMANGQQALYSNTTGSSNAANGYRALYSNTTGDNNIAIGFQALFLNTIGSFNAANGSQALFYNTTGSYNMGNGFRALFLNTAGNNNMANGQQALYSNTTGSSNVANGYQALYSNTTGSFNAANGYRALYSNTTGSSNVAIGANAIYNTIAADTLTGSNNVAIGNSAADNIRAAAAANVAIGNQVDLPTNNGSNQGVYQNVLFFTGASGTGTTIAAGSRAGIKTNAPASDFHVAGEVRIDDLKPTGAPRNIVGSSSTGDLSTMAWGNGLTVSVGDTVLRVDTSLILPKVNVSGTTNYLAKFTAGNRVGNSTIFDTIGRVGIGTTLPGTYLLNLRDSIGFSGNGMYFSSTNGGTANPGGHIIGTKRGSWGTRIDFVARDAAGSLTETVMSIDGEGGGGGNVGINTSSPSYPLHVNGTSYATTVITNGNFVGNGQLTTADARSGLVSIGPSSNTVPQYFMGGYGTFYGAGHTTKPGDIEFGVGQNTTGKIIFYTDNFGQNQTMTLTNNSFVGINTASPSRPLHVAGTTAIRIPVGNLAQRGTSGAGDIRVRSDTANLEFHNGTSWQTVINNADTSVFARDVQISGTANYLPKFTGSNAVGNSIVTQNGRSMYINSTQDNSGYTISNLFQFNGFGSSPTDQPSIGVIGNVGTTANHRPYLSMYRSAGNTADDKTLVPYNYYLGSITWQGADGTDFQPRGAEITAITDSITGVNDMPTALFFGTTANGQEQPTERMRITSAGNVGINTTTPSRRLHVEGETRISDLTTDPATRIVGADADGDLDAITIGNGVTFSSDTLKADTSVLATKTYVTDNAISTVYMPINLYAPGDTVANTTNSKAFFLVHSGLNGYCIDSYTVKAFSGSGTADIQIDKNGTGGNLQAISGTTTATKDTNIALATGDYIRGQVFNLSGTLVGLGLTLEIKKTCN